MHGHYVRVLGDGAVVHALPDHLRPLVAAVAAGRCPEDQRAVVARLPQEVVGGSHVDVPAQGLGHYVQTLQLAVIALRLAHVDDVVLSHATG